MKMKIYLQGCQTNDGTSFTCPLSSSVIIFILRYCQTNKYELMFVSHSQEESCCSYSVEILSGLSWSFTTLPDVPKPVQNVLLPSVYQPETALVRSGLCVLLRSIIKETHKTSQHLHLIDLLGFREGSMKMCAEVSGWTKLCEVDLSHSISQLILKLKANKLGKPASAKQLTLPCDLMKLEGHFLKKCRVHNDDKARRVEMIRLKDNVLKFAQGGTVDSSTHVDVRYFNELGEQTKLTIPRVKVIDSDVGHFKSFASSKNSCLQIEQALYLHHGVRKIKVEKLLDNTATALSTNGNINTDASTDKTSTTTEERGLKCLNSLVKGPSDLADLVQQLTLSDIQYVHTYSEGIEMTLADLILFVYICSLLEMLNFNYSCLFAHVPSILKWAHHMASLSTVASAGEQMGWSVKGMRDALDKIFEPKDNINEIKAELSFIQETEVNLDDDEMELTRCAKMKHKALKPEVIQALKKLETANIQPNIGNHPYGDQVHIDWSTLPPDVHPKEGDVPESRNQRKCQQLENLVTAVQSIAKPGDVLVDFCSGGGHLGIVMAYLLPECQVYLVENKEESLLKSCSRLNSLKLKNVTLYQCNLDYFVGKFDVGVCLHACGSATDMVLQLCLKSQASFVICPCCYGSIQKTHLLSYPRSQKFITIDLSYKDFLTLGHAADQTEFNIALEDRGRLCMSLVDTDRAEYAMEMGYTVNLCSLKPLSCTPKNNLLIGTTNFRNSQIC